MRPLWPGLAPWWYAFAAAAVVDAVFWLQSAADQAWRAGTELAFFPLLLLAVYSSLVAVYGWRDRRQLRRASPRHPAHVGEQVRGLDAELVRELERRYGHHG